jgi:P27 family predicted phage terminase small subunit
MWRDRVAPLVLLVGKRGPAPTPTALKKLRGNPGKRALPKNEPQPAPAAVSDCPPYLGAVAKAMWKRVAPELVALGLLSVLDVAQLAAYCEAFERRRSIEKEIRKTTVADALRQGLLRAAREEQALMMSIGGKFGFTPADRTRVATPTAQAPEKDEFAEWAKGKVIKGGKTA